MRNDRNIKYEIIDDKSLLMTFEFVTIKLINLLYIVSYDQIIIKNIL